MNDLSHLAHELARIAAPLRVPLSQALWDADQCAEYLRLSRDEFVSRVSKRAGFPKARNLGRKSLRWVAEEVIDWALSQREGR